MKRLQAYKYELMPTGDQQRDMRRFSGSCRFVFNKTLALQKERYERGEKKLGYVGLCKLLTEWRNGTETPWLKDAPVHPLQQTLKDLERAYANFFAKRADVQKLHAKVANIRRDYLHKTSHEISQNHAIVVIEDLQVRNMS
ncbi:MAG: helix-turn-helix domain-containing protein, partial [Anaerolineales bacterium]|nr:helix-turn-helix domain-containing protein [Anaerolineales bacterium]